VLLFIDQTLAQAPKGSIFYWQYFLPRENFSFPGPKVGACPGGLAVENIANILEN
jgi:hypothetical protein